MGIEGGIDRDRGDEPMFFVGVVEPETVGGDGAKGLPEGKGSGFQLGVDGSCPSFSSADVLDLFNSLSMLFSISTAGGEADRFLPLPTPLEGPASVATVTSAFRRADRACLRGDRSSDTLPK